MHSNGESEIRVDLDEQRGKRGFEEAIRREPFEAEVYEASRRRRRITTITTKATAKE